MDHTCKGYLQIQVYVANPDLLALRTRFTIHLSLSNAVFTEAGFGADRTWTWITKSTKGRDPDSQHNQKKPRPGAAPPPPHH
jgi:hypothetical protein